MHKRAILALSLLCVLATACSMPGLAPTPTPRPLPTATKKPATPVVNTPAAPSFPTLAGGSTQAAPSGGQPAGTQAALPQAATVAPPASFCDDPQVQTLIGNLKSAVLSGNGPMLASVVSPTHGMEARLYRNGTVITYDQLHAKFLFETTYSVDWGPAPGSGQETTGAFHDTIVPALREVFSKNYTLTCNKVQVGGASYQATWPYQGINFYSAHYPGTQANGNMDWRTWLLGVQYSNGRPYLYAIVPFQWEP